MEITPIHKRVIGLDVHQNKISACAIAEQADGTVTVEHCELAVSSATVRRWRTLAATDGLAANDTRHRRHGRCHVAGGDGPRHDQLR